MSWIDLLDENHFLRALFPQADPSLAEIRLHEVQLQQDGPVILLRLDLREYPDKPPVKWAAAQHNTVQVRLMGVGIHALTIRDWSTDNVGRLDIEPHAHGRKVQFEASACHIEAVVQHLRVAGVTAYQDARAAEAEDGKHE